MLQLLPSTWENDSEPLQRRYHSALGTFTVSGVFPLSSRLVKICGQAEIFFLASESVWRLKPAVLCKHAAASSCVRMCFGKKKKKIRLNNGPHWDWNDVSRWLSHYSLWFHREVAASHLHQLKQVWCSSDISFLTEPPHDLDTQMRTKTRPRWKKH